MIKIQTCLIDLDGVLCDFCGASLRLFDDPAPIEAVTPDQFLLWKRFGISVTQFWKRIEKVGHSFWSTLPEYPWARELYDICKQIAPVHVATSPSLDPACCSGKAEWIQRFFGDRYRAFYICPDKSLLAAPGRILIDDRESNIQDFEKAGGMGILWPMPWNNYSRFGATLPEAQQFVMDRLREQAFDTAAKEGA